MNESVSLKQKLIITIVKKGAAKIIIKASKQAGAEGATVLFGTGTGVHEAKRIFFLDIDPEKEVVFTLTTKETLNQILDAIVDAGKLNKPGNGITFVIDIKKTAGIVHLLRKNA